MGERHAIVEQRKNRVASFAESLFFSFAGSRKREREIIDYTREKSNSSNKDEQNAL